MNQFRIESKVYQLLTEDELTRDDDWYLIGSYLEKQSRLKGVEAIYLLKHSKDYQIPAAGSITRARRKIQHDYEHLRGTNYKGKLDREKEFREYYGS